MSDYLITWPPLTKGTLLRRYKRFMADVELENGRVITVHCPNSGRMLGCSEPGRTVFLSTSDNKNRKLPYTWEIIDMPGSLVVVNTLRANQAAKAAMQRGLISGLSGYSSIRSEVKISNHSRIDLLLEGDHVRPTLVEVKSATYAIDGRVMFPDAVTARGLKHLKELQRSLKIGFRCVMFFLVQRMDIHFFTSADHIDPAYAQGLHMACGNGVEVLVYGTEITHEGMALGPEIPCRF
jgi:sugar fermentation stimulation protein A